MIDNELDQLSRALIAATDRLNSQDFLDRQAKYIRLEQEARELGAQLEAEEAAVEKAQAALRAHFEGPEADTDGLFEEDRQKGIDSYFREAGYEPYQPDEFSTPRAAGALND